MEPKDVVNVLRNMIDAVKPGGLVLDLQVIRPNPLVESEGVALFEIDGEPQFAYTDAATASVDAAIADGRLTEEAVDDHDVRKHYTTGADLVEDFVGKKREVPGEWVPRMNALRQEVVLRERCRLRRLVTC